MNETITIVVEGTPVAKPRMTRRDKWMKRPAVVRYREWQDKVRGEISGAPPAQFVEHVSIRAFFEPPASWSKKKRLEAMGSLHRDRPDSDNLAKGVLDTLWPDGDSAIANLSIAKRWGNFARLEIDITWSA